jgi:phosphoribosyl 1,2-cyclic phosphodiesterase
MYGFCPLASGSKGNCIYLGTKKSKILIDCGISAKAIKERLSHINVSLSDIDAIFISHEHGDHIQGLKAIVTNFDIPIITNYQTAVAIEDILVESPKFKLFITGETFEFQDLEVHSFTVQHDAVDPVAFTFCFEGIKVGVCTDLGFVTSLVTNHLLKSHILYVEANHEPSMVHACSRPLSYKTRVLGKSGHLSNEACGTLITQVFHDEMKQVYLAHLSSECNSTEVALSTITNCLQQANIRIPLAIAHQDKKSTPTLFE